MERFILSICYDITSHPENVSENDQDDSDDALEITFGNETTQTRERRRRGRGNGHSIDFRCMMRNLKTRLWLMATCAARVHRALVGKNEKSAIYISCSYCFFTTENQDRREGGVAGATAPGPGPRQGPVKIKLCFSIICFCDIIELGPARGPEESNFHLVRSTLH